MIYLRFIFSRVIYIYIYNTHTHTHTYIYTHTHTELDDGPVVPKHLACC